MRVAPQVAAMATLVFVIAWLMAGTGTAGASDVTALRGPVPLDPTMVALAYPANSPAVASSASGPTTFLWAQQGLYGGVAHVVVWEFPDRTAGTQSAQMARPVALGNQATPLACYGNGTEGRAVFQESAGGSVRFYVINLSGGSSLSTASPLDPPLDAVQGAVLGCDAAGRGQVAAIASRNGTWELELFTEGAAAWGGPSVISSGAYLATATIVENAAAVPGTPLSFGLVGSPNGTRVFSKYECSGGTCVLSTVLPVATAERVYGWFEDKTAFAALLVFNLSSGTLFLSWVDVVNNSVAGTYPVADATGGAVLDAKLAPGQGGAPAPLVLRRSGPTGAEVAVWLCGIAWSPCSYSGTPSTMQFVMAPSGGVLSASASDSQVALSWGIDAGGGQVGFAWLDPMDNFSLIRAEANPTASQPARKAGLAVFETPNGLLAITEDLTDHSFVVVGGDTRGNARAVNRLLACNASVDCTLPMAVRANDSIVIMWASAPVAGPPPIIVTLWLWVLDLNGSNITAPVAVASSNNSGVLMLPALSWDPSAGLGVAWQTATASETGIRQLRAGPASLASFTDEGTFHTASRPSDVRLLLAAAWDGILLSWSEINGSAPFYPYELRSVWWAAGGAPPSNASARVLGAYARPINGKAAWGWFAGGPTLAVVQPLGDDNGPADAVTLFRWSAPDRLAGGQATGCGNAPGSGALYYRSTFLATASENGSFAVAWLRGSPDGMGDDELNLGWYRDAENAWSCYQAPLRASALDHASFVAVSLTERPVVALMLANGSSYWSTRLVALFANLAPPAPTDLSPGDGALVAGAPSAWTWTAGPDRDDDAVSFVVELQLCAVGGPVVTATTAAAAIDLRAFAAQGEFCWRVGAYDGFETSWSAVAHVTIAPTGPIAILTGPTTSYEGETVTFDATASETAAGPLRFWFDLDGDGLYEVANTTAGDTSARFDNEATVRVGLRVMDGLGRTNATSLLLRVLNLPPTIAIGGNRTMQEGDEAMWNALASDPGSFDLVTIRWFLPGGAAALGAAVHFRATVRGTFTVQVLALDDAGASAMASFELVVLPVAPNITLTGPSELGVGETGVFAVTVTHPSLGVRDFNWSWEADGELIGAGINIEWTNWTLGAHTIRVTGRDDVGAPYTREISVLVGLRGPRVALELVENTQLQASFAFTIENATLPPDSVRVVISRAGDSGNPTLIVLTPTAAGRFEVPYSLSGSSYTIEVRALWGDGTSATSNSVAVLQPGTEVQGGGSDLSAVLILGVAAGLAAVAFLVLRRRRREPDT
jgi:hypothetical protein